MIGRHRERVFLEEELARAFRDEGRFVVLGGEAGIGKTTLARGLMAEARAQGAHVLAGHCYDLYTSPPFGPWLDLAASFRGGEGLPALPAAFSGGRLEGIRSQSELFAEMHRFFVDLSQTGPVAVLLEDLHWTDPSSLDLLRFLVSHLANMRVFLFVTYRVDELTRRHPFYQQLPALIRTGNGIRLDLRRLEIAELSQLVSQRYELSFEDRASLVTYLVRHSDGNPFFATELLRALEAERRLVRNGDGWTLEALNRVVLPELITQVIESRVSRLGEETRRLLSIGAIIGQEISLELWSAVAAASDDEIFDVVEVAAEMHLLEPSRDGRMVKFVHALTRLALYESVVPPRRRAWHGTIANELIGRHGSDPEAIAHHLERAGDERAAEWLVVAGERAQRAYAWLAASDRFQTAARLLEQQAGQERQRGWLLQRAARLLRYADPASGEALLDEACRLAQVAGDELLRVECDYSVGLLKIYQDDLTRGLPAMTEGIEALAKLPADIARGDTMTSVASADSLPKVQGEADSEVESGMLLLERTGIHHRYGSLPWWNTVAGKPERALAMGWTFANAVSHIEQPGGLIRASLGHCFQGMALAYASKGEPALAIEMFERSREIYRDLDHVGVITLSYLNQLRYVTLPFMADKPGVCAEVGAAAFAAARQASGAFRIQVTPDITKLAMLTLHGEWEEAAAICAEIANAGNGYLQQEINDTLLTLSVYRDDRAQIWSLIDSALPHGPESPAGARPYLTMLFYARAAADISLISGEPEIARGWLEAHARWRPSDGSVLGLAEELTSYSSFWRRTGKPAEAVRSGEAAVAAATEPRQPLALSAAHLELGRAFLEMRTYAEAERNFTRAQQIACDCDAQAVRIEAVVAQAELMIATGRSGGAEPLLTEAMTWARARGASRISIAAAALLDRLKLATPSMDPFGLTPREREVLVLVAEGMTDSAVGERLYISPRTVSQHLRSIYGKLEVSSRAAATRVALENNLA